MKKLPSANKFIFIFFLIIILSSVFVRFYNLNWGAPFYFHPDERNIASAVTRLNITNNMNPEFFAYGSLPIYTTYFIGVIENSLRIFPNLEELNLSVGFEQSVIVLRSISAILSVFIIYLTFSIVKKGLEVRYAVLASSLMGLNVGLIQYSRFGTFEMWLTFLFLMLFMFVYKYLVDGKYKWLIFSSIFLGLLLSVKVSSAVFLPLAAAIILLKIFRNKKDIKNKRNLLKAFSYILTLPILSFLVLLSTSPFILLDFHSFRGSMDYESAVALGTLEVFYTAGFKDSIPIVYQFIYVYPFILNPVNLVLFVFSLLLSVREIVLRKNVLLSLTLIFFLLIFLSQAFLYVKWIRYYIPTIPFAIIILVFGIKSFVELFRKKTADLIFWIIFTISITTSCIFTLSYFITVQQRLDSRIEAYEFLENNANHNAKIISEVFDLGIIPFNRSFNNIELFNSYELDDEWNKDSRKKEAQTLLSNSDYIVLPSQRILRNRILKPKHFPEGNTFYKNLEQNQLIYATTCDIYCRILYLGNPIYSVEETANVFDRPMVFIYKIKK